MTIEVQNVVEQIDKEQPQSTTETAQAAPEVDLDDAEVAAALAAAEAEAKGTAQPAPAAAAPAAQPAQPQAAAAAAPQQPAAPAQPEGSDVPVMIPKARLDEVLAKSAEKDTTIARLQGENQALKSFAKPDAAGANPQQPGQQPAETHDQKLDRLHTEKEALAKKFDDGEIGLAELRRAERKLDDQIAEAREVRLTARVQAAVPTPAGPRVDGDLYLETQTDRLEADHPYTKLITEKADWAYLRDIAERQLVAEGKWEEGRIAQTPTELFLLRERVAVLTDTYGPVITGKTVPLPAKSTNGSQQPAPPTPSGKSPTAQARESKLAQAASAPPDINRLTPQGGQTEFTEDMIAALNEDEILKLPESVRARFR